MYKITETTHGKILRSDTYNYIFNRNTGALLRWGRTPSDNAKFSPFGPEILDIEITTKCKNNCSFCYKANRESGRNMKLQMFKDILDKMPKTLTQIAFGADADLTSNPDLFKMMRYAREKNIVPNITVAEVTPQIADLLRVFVGAVAVSRYAKKSICYDSVRNLLNASIKQVNIHQMISQETYQQAIETINDYKTDKRLEGINAIVFLSLKKKGRGVGYTPLTQEQFNSLVHRAETLDVPIGFDSCSTAKFFKYIKGHPKENQYKILVEPCESFGMFSAYINVRGEYYPCSFCEDKIRPINVLQIKDFVKDVWNDPLINRYRQEALSRYKNNKYECPIYEV